MASCFVSRRLPGTALDRLREEHEVEVWGSRLPPPRKALVEAACAAEGLLTLLTDQIDAELLDACPNVRAIANFAVGVDNIDLAAATARGIPVGHTPDVLTESTADLTLALMLAVMRRLADGSERVLRGDWLTWEPASLLGRDLHRATVLIVGPGRIGHAVARRLEGFGANVIEAGRGASLGPLLEEADVVTLHCPLNDATRNLIDEDALRAMKPTAYLVNAARGPIVNTAALNRALREKWIAGAALDVTDPEPLPRGHVLLEAPNLLVVPHVASATHATREAMADMAVDNLLAGLRGERMPHVANPELYGD
jgi:lactate dehydrogenase-like 2-hydroxyacid dehydrogenase